MIEAPTKPSGTQSPAVGRHTLHVQKRNAVDKFFILKSLTIEDLNASVRTGKWATQSHNEKKLNEAFQVGGHSIVFGDPNANYN